LIDPDLYPDAFLSIHLWSTSARIVHCGSVLIGLRAQIGQTLYSTEVGIVDYSRKERDEFGAITLIERGYSDLVRYRFAIDTQTISQARQFLASRRAKGTVYVGAASAPETIAYGYYKDFTIPIESLSVSEATLEIESVTQDTPTQYSEMAVSAYFIRDDGTACIETRLGRAIKLPIVDEQVLGSVKVAVPDYDLQPGDTFEWILQWTLGETTNTYTVTPLETDCGQTLKILEWPTGERFTQLPATVSFRGRITPANGTPWDTLTATLYLAEGPFEMAGTVDFIDLATTDYRTAVGLGAGATVQLVNDAPAYRSKAMPLERPLTFNEVCYWKMTWIVGTSDVPFSVIEDNTQPAAPLSVLVWPGEDVLDEDIVQEPAIAEIRAIIVTSTGEILETAPAVLVVGCASYTGLNARWYDSVTNTYALLDEVGVLGFDPDRWTARVNGIIPEGCTVSWQVEWDGEGDAPAVWEYGSLVTVNLIQSEV
jgi:hypothetical protein